MHTYEFNTTYETFAERIRARGAVESRCVFHRDGSRAVLCYRFFDSDGADLGSYAPCWHLGTFYHHPRPTAYHERHLLPLYESWRHHPYGGDGRFDFLNRRALP